MAKSKKQVSKTLQTKITKHKAYTTKLAKQLSDTFLVNRLIGDSILLPFDGPDPFEFTVTILINSVITIKSVNVNGVRAKREDIIINNGNIICKIKAFVSTYNFLLMIDAEGNSHSSTTFNLTCDGKKVFSNDQNIIISGTGRGGYSNPKIPLP